MALNILTLKRQKRFLSFFIIFLDKIRKILRIVQKKKNTNNLFATNYEKFEFFLLKILGKMKKLFISYNLIFSLQRKSSRLSKKRLRKIFNLYPFKLRKIYSQLLYFTSTILTTYLQLFSLFTQLKLEELKFYCFLLPAIKGRQ